MNELFDQYFDYALYGAIAWVIFIIFASLLYRAGKGKQFPAFPEGTVRFHEKWVSGRSLKNLFTRFGGARKVLDVTVGRGYLLIRPVFPFNLMFLPEFTDLEHVVPIDRIIEVKEIESFGQQGVFIRFQSESRTGKDVELYLRNTASFIEVMGKGTKPE